MSTETKFDEDLKEELFAFEDATEGNTVEAEIIRVEKDGGYHGRTNIKVWAKIDSYGQKSVCKTMMYPRGNSKEYEFVRLVESLGYTVGSAEHMIGDKVNCRYSEDDGWNIIIPETKTEKARDIGKEILSWIILPFTLLKGHKETMESDTFVNDNISFILNTGFLIFLWFFAAFFALFGVSILIDIVTTFI